MEEALQDIAHQLTRIADQGEQAGMQISRGGRLGSVGPADLRGRLPQRLDPTRNRSHRLIRIDRRMTTHKPNVRRQNGTRRNQLVARHKAAVKSGRTCGICGKPIDLRLKYPDPWSFVVDEIIPIARGGNPYSWTNTEPTHRWCNTVKGTHTLEWAQREVRRLMAGQQGQQSKPPTGVPFRKIDI